MEKKGTLLWWGVRRARHIREKKSAWGYGKELSKILEVTRMSFWTRKQGGSRARTKGHGNRKTTQETRYNGRTPATGGGW